MVALILGAAALLKIIKIIASLKSRAFTGKGIVVGGLSGSLVRKFKRMLYLSSLTQSDL